MKNAGLRKFFYWWFKNIKKYPLIKEGRKEGIIIDFMLLIFSVIKFNMKHPSILA